MTVLDEFAEFLANMPEYQSEELTIAEFIDLTHVFYRKAIYGQHPTADPKLVEALLLLQKNTTEEAYKDLGLNLGDPLIDIGKKDPKPFESYNKFGQYLGRAILTTMNMLT